MMFRLRWHGWLGLLIMISATVLVPLGAAWITTWYTPIMWTGYIFLADSVVLRREGTSLITGSPRKFVLMLWLSALVWLLFEIYNLRLRNWFYTNLPANLLVREFGYLWAFATIFPGIFQTHALLESFGVFRRQVNRPRLKLTPGQHGIILLIGLAFVAIPPMLPIELACYTFGFVWLGFIPLMDPINYRLGAPSLLRDWEEGNRRRLLTLLAAGAVCGLLWESWNYFTLQFGGAGWIYTLPYPLNLLENIFRIGQMPLLGFLGFPPFALESWALWQFLRVFLLPDSAS
jgi:hypothetical protein